MNNVTLATIAQNNNDVLLRIRSYAIYIFMLTSIIVLCVVTIRNQWDYGPVTFATILGSITFFIVLERIIPNNKQWHPTWKEWLRDGSYFSLVCFVGAMSQAMITSIAMALTTSIGNIPLYAEIPAALLIGTFAGYWFHRLGHKNNFFWQAHGIHHTPKKVNLANNSVTHFFDIIGPAMVTQLPLLVLNFSPESMFVTSVFTVMQGYFVHANVNMKLGNLSYFIATPEAHRLHHSLDMVEAGNYGSDIMLWDRLFGTFTWKEGLVPNDVGVINLLDFPPTAAIHKNIIHPFVYLYKKIIAIKI